MKKKENYLVNEGLLVFHLTYALFLLAVGITLFHIERLLAGVIFSVLSIPFIYLSFLNGSVVSITSDYIVLKFLGLERYKMKWTDIAEVDVMGLRLFNQGKDKKKCGSLYLVFSSKHMDDDMRFKLIMNWPPKNEIYLRFTKERLFYIQSYWIEPVQKYNVGMLDI